MKGKDRKKTDVVKNVSSESWSLEPDEHEQRTEEKRTRGVPIPVSPSSPQIDEETQQRKREIKGLFQELEAARTDKVFQAKKKKLTPTRSIALTQSIVQRLRDEPEQTVEPQPQKSTEKKKRLRKKAPTSVPAQVATSLVQSNDPDI